jgi:predicted Zn finger-like uncharacterized protein
MATKTGFKQQCPHCEARVPIKDEKLIGEEIKCPKCKQPFVVEDPSDADSAASIVLPEQGGAGKAKGGPKGVFKDEGEEEEGKGKKRAKLPDFKSAKLIVGLGLAFVTLVLLGVTYMLMSKKTPPTQQFAGGTPGGNPSSPPPPPPPKPATKTEQPSVTVTNPTNLLPGDSEIVLNLNLTELLKHPLGRMVFDPSTSSQSNSFESKYGFPIAEVERWLVAGRYTQDWVFEVIRTRTRIQPEVVRKALHLRPGDAPILGQDYFVSSYNWLEAGSPTQILGTPPRPRESSAPGTRPLAVRFVDPQTIVLGDLAPVQEFLKVKGQWKSAGGGGSYATFNPRLKGIMDRVESHGPLLFSWGIDLDTEKPPTFNVAGVPISDLASTLSAALQIKDGVFFGFAAIDAKGDNQATTMKTGISQVLHRWKSGGEALGMKIDMTETQQKAPEGQRRRRRFDDDDDGGGAAVLPRAAELARDDFVQARQGAATPANKQQNQPIAKLALNVNGRAIDVSAEVHLTQELYDRMVKATEPFLIRTQNEVEMTTAHPNSFTLARALGQYAVEHKQFPAGVEPRHPSPARANRPWPPDQRVSWMASVLPYLGYDAIFQRIKPQKSWQDPDNLIPSVTIIPAFLDPYQGHESMYVRYPGMDYDVAATHFVGIAGVGQDAAEYSASDPLVAKKLGVFGYNRATRVSDIVDGLANTILLAEVPPIYKSPWIAGGGSTIRGVPETKSIQPFVSTTYDGKRGTMVIMADGTVRFLTENTSDEVFKALATIKGQEPKLSIEKLRPRWRLRPKRKPTPRRKQILHRISARLEGE